MQLTNILAFAGAASAAALHGQHRQLHKRIDVDFPGTALDFQPFCNNPNFKRATPEEIASGVTGCNTWGDNIKVISSALIPQYDYTVQFESVDGRNYQVMCWNTVGRDGGVNGFWPSQGNAFTADVPAGKTLSVAFMTAFNGACGFSENTVHIGQSGIVDAMWAEFNFGMGTMNMAGADCSSNVADSTGNRYDSCRICQTGGNAIPDEAGACSSITPDGVADHAYVKGDTRDGLSINFQPGSLALKVEMGWA
jgi:hypothetical protein